MDQDIKAAEQLIEYEGHFDFYIDLEKYYSTYLFATENISGFMQKMFMATDFSFSDKRVLTVCSSGDQIFNFLLAGVDSIEAYDINIFTKYFFYLKKAAVESLSYFEFFNFFFPNAFRKNKVFSRKLFEKIKDWIQNEEARVFWETLFSKYDGEKIYYSNLFIPNCYSQNTYIACNTYLQSEENYYLLRQKLKNYHFQFYRLNIFRSVMLCDGKYDFIYLSNIMDRLEVSSELEYVREVKNILLTFKDYLVVGGRIGVCYLYCYVDDYWYDYPLGKLKSRLLREKYFKEDYQCVDFPGISNLKGSFLKDRDALLLSKKK